MKKVSFDVIVSWLSPSIGDGEAEEGGRIKLVGVSLVSMMARSSLSFTEDNRRSGPSTSDLGSG